MASIVANEAERKLLSYCTSAQTNMKAAHDPITKSAIPPYLEQEAKFKSLIENTKLRSIERLQGIADYMKHDFMTWMNSPQCTQCHVPTVCTGKKEPKRGESMQGISRIETFRCPTCSEIYFFPRHDNPLSIIRTKIGRCGEYSTLMCAICVAYGWETRMVYDNQDHVWVEVFMDDRWMHVDPCEAIVDQPLLYEKGWGKKQTLVLSIGVDHIQDTTNRYTAQSREQLIARRKEKGETIRESVVRRIIVAMSSELPHEKQTAVVNELTELMSSAAVGGENLPGRSSGSAAWRRQRGEGGVLYKSIGDAVQAACLPGRSKSSKELDDFLAAHPNVTKVEIAYQTNTDSVTIGGWTGQSASPIQPITVVSVDTFLQHTGTQRKHERDWKKTYICRAEGQQFGVCSLVVHLPPTTVTRVASIDVKLSTKCLNNAETAVLFYENVGDITDLAKQRQISTSDDGDLVDYHIDLRHRALEVDDTGYCRIAVCVQMWGGEGDESWQHSQLARSDDRGEMDGGRYVVVLNLESHA